MILSGLIPFVLVIYFSLHDTFGGGHYIWVGTTWYEQVLGSAEFRAALLRSLGFSILALALQLPLGIYIALKLPTQGLFSKFYIVICALPPLKPVIVVGYIWKFLVLQEIGLLSEFMAILGWNYDLNDPVVVWITLILMNTWHWTSLIVLLCFAGLRAIPDAYYQVAVIDRAGRWAIFRHIELPKLRLVLLIAELLRFMDSFIIYTETYVLARGDPGVTTKFLSLELIRTASVQFDLGEGGAIALIYAIIVVVVAWLFFSRIIPPKNIKSQEDA
jgi:glycerol transport system permease protein